MNSNNAQKKLPRKFQSIRLASVNGVNALSALTYTLFLRRKLAEANWAEVNLGQHRRRSNAGALWQIKYKFVVAGSIKASEFGCINDTLTS